MLYFLIDDGFIHSFCFLIYYHVDPQETSPYDTFLDGETGDSTNEKAIAMSDDSPIGSTKDDATAISEYGSNDAGVIV